MIQPMNKSKVYIPCTMSESDVIANHPQGALPLKEVERYVLDEAELDKIVKQSFLDGKNSVGNCA